MFKNDASVERYVSALVREIDGFSNENIFADTIYIGGGTPSLLSVAQLEKILSAVHRKFTIDQCAEITLEMNPGTVTPETLRGYKNLGVNRASFGAQTFDDRELKRLGRHHTARDVRETIELLRAADFGNVSFDLIAGLPRQTLADWRRNLDEALKLKPEHLSLYLLEVNEGTPLAQQIKQKRQPLPDEDVAAEMYELTISKTAEKDYGQYEIANFARPGFKSRHNSKYWLCAPVYAFGNSAHSFDGKIMRWSNERDTARYVALAESSQSTIIEKDAVDLKSEFVFLGLRMTDGIDLDEYQKRFKLNLLDKYREDLQRLSEAELIEISASRLKLTQKGFLYSNEVFEVFI